MGELAVSRDQGVLRTLLGSCVGLALYDRRWRVAGLAHAVLPVARGNDGPPGKFVDTAVPALIDAMRSAAGRRLDLTARLAGGANMFATETTRTIGTLNLEAAEAALAAVGVPVTARHCGGARGRRLSLDAATGVITIEVAGCDPFIMPESDDRRSPRGQARAHR